MENAVINRATQKIDVNDFRTLTQLHIKYEWLQEEPDALFDLWCLADREEQKRLIEFLIHNFLYINGKDLDHGCKSIVNQIEIEWGLTATNTIITATCDNSNPDGSQMILQKIKNKLSGYWREKMLYNSLPVAANELQKNYNIVLIDDFIGTGDTICKKVKYLLETLHKRKIEDYSIYIVSLAAMNFAKEPMNELNIPYYSVHWLLKGISEKMNLTVRANAIKAMEDLEAKLKDKVFGRKLLNFGYKRSESLFALESNNIPNNVFPIFWWTHLKDNTLRKTLFHRI